MTVDQIHSLVNASIDTRYHENSTEKAIDYDFWRSADEIDMGQKSGCETSGELCSMLRNREAVRAMRECEGKSQCIKR